MNLSRKQQISLPRDFLRQSTTGKEATKDEDKGGMNRPCTIHLNIPHQPHGSDTPTTGIILSRGPNKPISLECSGSLVETHIKAKQLSIKRLQVHKAMRIGVGFEGAASALDGKMDYSCSGNWNGACKDWKKYSCKRAQISGV